MSRDQNPERHRCERCGRLEASAAVGLCVPCAIRVRIDVSTGLLRLERFLARRAAFGGDWEPGTA